MGNQNTEQAIVATQTSFDRNQKVTQLALFKADGSPKTLADPAAAQVNSVATTVGGIVTDFNALLAKLRTAGILLP